MLLVLVLLIMVVPGLAVQSWFYLVRFEQRRGQELEANLEVARAVSAAFDAYIQGVLRQELAIGLALAELPPRSPEQISDYMAAALRGNSVARNTGWIDPRGFPIGGAAGSAPTSMAERPFFREILSGKDWAVSDLQQSRVDGNPVVVIARGMRDRRGDLVGVVTMALNPDRLGEALGIQRVEQGSFALIDRQGRHVYRHPDTAITWEKRLVPDLPGSIIAAALAGREAAGTVVVPLLGETRMSAAAPINSVGWAVVAGRPEADVMGPLYAELRSEFAVLGVVALGALLAAAALSRAVTGPLLRLREQAAALGRRQFDRHVAVDGPQELHDLADAFNSLADQVRQHEEQREVYIQTISHDLRSPLTALLGQAQLLQRALRRAGDEVGVQRAEAVIASARQMNAMIQDLADSARIEAGQVRLNPRPVDMESFVTEVTQRLAVTAGGDRLCVKAAPVPLVLADPTLLERILANLLTNALKYSAPGTEITVAVAQQGSEVFTAVRDCGPGIAAEELPRLFERYHRTRQARETREGLGLGLYITKGLVEAHGGRIWAESTPGVGSQFIFTLPAQSGPATIPVTASVAAE